MAVRSVPLRTDRTTTARTTRDPLAEFQQLVAQGKIHYFVASGGGRGTTSEISEWVESTYTARTVGNQTVYDLSSGA